AAIAREGEKFAQQRASQLAKANEALRSSLDALASVPELAEFIKQVMAAITRQLGAVSSMLRVLDAEQKSMRLELLFQDGQVMSPNDVKYPEHLRSLSLDEVGFASLEGPVTVLRLADRRALMMSEGLRVYLLGLGVKTLLIIPLTSRGEANGVLSFRFMEERDFQAEELEIARALATQASLAIRLTQLAKTARQSAVLEERNRLSGEIHDSLAQNFAGIAMQLAVAEEELAAGEGAPLCRVRLAHKMTELGLAEARRSALSLRSTVIEESGLIGALQMLVERSNVAGRLRCNFRSNCIPEETLPPRVQHELLRIAQEAISNAIRHGEPTVVIVTLRWEAAHLILQIKDNGSGIPKTRRQKSETIGLRSMRERAARSAQN
ncbi:MAG TPA: histidine kinase, partial [Chthoniobacterales bacterium]